MFEEQVTEGHEKIVKAQDLFRRLMACEPGGEFKKIFATAIQQNSLPLTQVEQILRGFGYSITEGVISDHPDAHRTSGSNDTALPQGARKPRHAV